MKAGPVTLADFLRDESGAYASTSYIAATVAISIPLGLMFLSIYESLCDGGRYANYLIGLF